MKMGKKRDHSARHNKVETSQAKHHRKHGRVFFPFVLDSSFKSQRLTPTLRLSDCRPPSSLSIEPLSCGALDSSHFKWGKKNKGREREKVRTNERRRGRKR